MLVTNARHTGLYVSQFAWERTTSGKRAGNVDVLSGRARLVYRVQHLFMPPISFSPISIHLKVNSESHRTKQA